VKIDVSGSRFTITGGGITTFNGSFTSGILSGTITMGITSGGASVISSGKIVFSKET
jgi:hypothetical protein